MTKNAILRCWLFICLTIPAATLSGQELSERQWSTSDGRFQVDAVFVQKKKDKVVLKRSDTGKTIEISLWRLSEDDKKYVAEQRTPEKEPEKAKKADEDRAPDHPKSPDAVAPLDPATLAMAPPEFIKKGKEIADEIKAKGGFAVAGQIVDKNDNPLRKGMYVVALQPDNAQGRKISNERAAYGINAHIADCFEDGWFITHREIHASYNTLLAASFVHDEVSTSLPIEEGKVNFWKISLDTTPRKDLINLNGYIQDEKGRPVANATVTLTHAVSGHSYGPAMMIKTSTDANGMYSFPEVASQPYGVKIYSPSFQYPPGFFHSMSSSFFLWPGDKQVSSNNGGPSRLERGRIMTMLQSPRILLLETVFQPDGSPDFDKSNVVRNQYWLTDVGSTGGVVMGNPVLNRINFDTANIREVFAGDVELSVMGGRFFFIPPYDGDQQDKSGLYTLGKTNFDSVKKGLPFKIQRENVPCELNHVYVVRTGQKGNYARFVVRSIDVMEPLLPQRTIIRQIRK